MFKKVVHIVFISTVMLSQGLAVVDHYDADMTSIVDFEHSEKSEVENDDLEEEKVDFLERAVIIHDLSDFYNVDDNKKRYLNYPFVSYYELHDPPPEK